MLKSLKLQRQKSEFAFKSITVDFSLYYAEINEVRRFFNFNVGTALMMSPELRIRIKSYSYRRESTGLAKAALIA